MLSLQRSLPLDAQNAVRSLIPHLTGPTDAIPLEDMVIKVLSGMRKILFGFQTLYRVGFVLGIMAFEWCPFAFGFGFCRFSLLSFESQEKYCHSWSESRFYTFREFFKSLKGLAMLAYFSEPKVWAYIGYDPEPHIKKRIIMRQEFLAKEKGAQ